MKEYLKCSLDDVMVRVLIHLFEISLDSTRMSVCVIDTYQGMELSIDIIIYNFNW